MKQPPPLCPPKSSPNPTKPLNPAFTTTSICPLRSRPSQPSTPLTPRSPPKQRPRIQPPLFPPNGVWKAGQPRRPSNSQITQIRTRSSRSSRPLSPFPLLSSLVRPGASRTAWPRLLKAGPFCFRVVIVLRVSRSSMPTTFVIPSVFFSRWALFSCSVDKCLLSRWEGWRASLQSHDRIHLRRRME